MFRKDRPYKRVLIQICKNLQTTCFLRAKTARVITFEQFSHALAELATKRFKGKSKEEALLQIYSLLVGKEPANMGVTVSTSSVLKTLHILYITLMNRSSKIVGHFLSLFMQLMKLQILHLFKMLILKCSADVWVRTCKCARHTFFLLFLSSHGFASWSHHYLAQNTFNSQHFY